MVTRGMAKKPELDNVAECAKLCKEGGAECCQWSSITGPDGKAALCCGGRGKKLKRNYESGNQPEDPE